MKKITPCPLSAQCITKFILFFISLSAKPQNCSASSVTPLNYNLDRYLSGTSKQLTLITSHLETLLKQQCKQDVFTYGIQAVVGELQGLKSALASKPDSSSHDTSHDLSIELLSHISKQLTTLDTSLNRLISNQNATAARNKIYAILNLEVNPFNTCAWNICDPIETVLRDCVLRTQSAFYWVRPIGMTGIILAGTQTGVVALE